MTTERFAPQPTDIAIIGMSARVPGARCIEQFWQNLCDDVDAATPLGASQMQASGVSPDLYENPLYVRSAYLLDGADTFDSRTFRYSPREAKLIDPPATSAASACPSHDGNGRLRRRGRSSHWSFCRPAP